MFRYNPIGQLFKKLFATFIIIVGILLLFGCDDGDGRGEKDPGLFDFAFVKSDSNGVILENGKYAETDTIYQENTIVVVLKTADIIDGTILGATFEPLGIVMDTVMNPNLVPGKTYRVRVPYHENIKSDPRHPNQNTVRTWVNVRYRKNGTTDEYEERSYWRSTTVIQPQRLLFDSSWTIVAETRNDPIINLITDTVIMTDYFISRHFFLGLKDQFRQSLQNVISIEHVSHQSGVVYAQMPTTTVDSVAILHNPGYPTSNWNEVVLFFRLSPIANRTIAETTFYMRVTYKPHMYAAAITRDFNFKVTFKKPS